MATLNPEFLETLKSKLNIVEIASNYITLERKGATYWGCCPFHHEKTPSFAINEADQFYHCFGCGESGDVIKFVREMENLEFIDAVKTLAERAGVEMPKTNFDSQKTVEQKRKRDVLLKIMNDCAHFYLNNLNSGMADPHIEYILQRKIPANIVRIFGLGASLNFTDLPKFLLDKGYSRQDIIDSGTVNYSDGKLTDAQGGRLVFPIINAMDEVVAFGGRVLKKTDFAKYKNTKETAIFNKSKTLYNINLLKKLKKSQTIKEIIMVEGYMDTISLYQAGFKNVVASMGTSLTQDQARLIKRYADTVLISYDGDGAGQKANMRGLEILKGEGLKVKVVPLPEGLDPDDVIKQTGAEGYAKCLESAMPLIDYKLKTLKRSYDIKKTDERREYVSEAIKIIKTADSAAEQDELLKSLHDESGVTFEALKRDLASQPAKTDIKPQIKPRKDNATALQKAARFVIAAFLFSAKCAQDYDVSKIPFDNEVHIIIAKYIAAQKLLGDRVQPAELFEFFEENTPEYDELTYILDYLDGGDLKGGVAEKYFADCVCRLKLGNADKQIESIKKLLAAATGVEERKLYAERLQTIIKQKEKLKSGEIK